VSNAEETYERLKRVNEPKGYFFSDNPVLVMELIDGLLVNKERYGYMCCPCRLASGSRENDKDIICPCDYREEDVKEYGSCYCNLYVSKEWNDRTIPRVPVPERRPAEKAAWMSWPGQDA
jgi:ferredoxin-thioredoxin reductase catalytic subunit